MSEKNERAVYQYVYVVYAKKYKDFSSKKGFIKIGRSVEYERRFTVLERDAQCEIQPLFLLGLKSRDLAVAVEWYFHNRFKFERVENEWFRYTKGVYSFFNYNLFMYGDDMTHLLDSKE